MVNPLQTNNRTGTKYGGVSATSVPSHSILTDLATGDDHPQYVRTDGTRASWPVPAVFTSTVNGLAPASGGGTTNFLRADGTWAAPSGGGGGSGLDQPAVMARMAFGGF